MRSPFEQPHDVFLYRAYELVIASEIELPGFLSGKGTPDLVIRKGAMPNLKPDPQATDSFVQTDRDQMHLCLGPYIGANLLVRNGNEILVDILNDGQMDDIRLAILGLGLTALLFQRGHLVLHGNTIHTQRGAIVICGQQQAGKSTLTTALYKRGYSIIADDLTAVKMHSGKPLVMPGAPMLKLWKDTLLYFGESIESLRPVQQTFEKYRFPLNESFHNRVEPLNALYILKKADVESPQISYLSGIERFRAIFSQIRSYQPEHLSLEKGWLVEICALLADKLTVAVVERPVDGDSIEAVAELVISSLNTEEYAK